MNFVRKVQHQLHPLSRFSQLSRQSPCSATRRYGACYTKTWEEKRANCTMLDTHPICSVTGKAFFDPDKKTTR